MPTLIETLNHAEHLNIGDPVCHLYAHYGSAPRARCGVPRDEQQPHVTFESQTAVVCAGCGLVRCPTCRRRLLDSIGA